MLILPPGHAQAVQQRHTFRAREKWMIGGVLAALGALVVAFVVSFATVGPKSGHGCISVSLAYSTGGAQVNRCGGAARSLCSSVGHANGTGGGAGRRLATECRKAGLPVG